MFLDLIANKLYFDATYQTVIMAWRQIIFSNYMSNTADINGISGTFEHLAIIIQHAQSANNDASPSTIKANFLPLAEHVLPQHGM